MTQAKPIEILLVEDNAADIELTQEAFEESLIANNLHIARDGVQALDFLYQRPPYQDAPMPDLILLDLNMPRKGGKEVLDDIKKNENLKAIPVVVLTTSSAEEDIVRSYQLYANCYITKPVDFNQFIKVVHSIEGYWFSIVKLPETR